MFNGIYCLMTRARTVGHDLGLRAENRSVRVSRVLAAILCAQPGIVSKCPGPINDIIGKRRKSLSIITANRNTFSRNDVSKLFLKISACLQAESLRESSFNFELIVNFML